MLHPMFDEIQACSDAELQSILRKAILANYKGRLNFRIDEIMEEIKKRSELVARGLEEGTFENIVIRED